MDQSVGYFYLCVTFKTKSSARGPRPSLQGSLTEGSITSVVQVVCFETSGGGWYTDDPVTEPKIHRQRCENVKTMVRDVLSHIRVYRRYCLLGSPSVTVVKGNTTLRPGYVTLRPNVSRNPKEWSCTLSSKPPGQIFPQTY